MHSTAKCEAKKRHSPRRFNALACSLGWSCVSMCCVLPSLSEAQSSTVNGETYQLVQATNDALRAAYTQKFHTPTPNPYTLLSVFDVQLSQGEIILDDSQITTLPSSCIGRTGSP
jgi:hypothetical protein